MVARLPVGMNGHGASFLSTAPKIINDVRKVFRFCARPGKLWEKTFGKTIFPGGIFLAARHSFDAPELVIRQRHFVFDH